MIYDMPNATIEHILRKSTARMCPATQLGGIEQVMTEQSEMQAVDSNLIHHMQNDELAAYGLHSKELQCSVW